jgi:UDP-glucose 4-epimerase
MQNNKVTVFGGSGFLGSHVSDSLTDAGYQVSIFDVNKSKYIKDGQKMVTGDITDFNQVNKAIKDSKYVYHFAGIADINKATKYPIESVKKNILGTTNILEACRMQDVERIFFASTIYVYSELGSFYRSTKQACELLIENYYEEFGLNYTVLRYGSLYGKRANDFNFINSAIREALEKGKITRKGNGEEIRDYINILDAAQASIEVIDYKYINSHIIIKGSQTIKVKDLLSMINEIMGNKIDIQYLKDKHYKGHYQLTPYAFRPRFAKKYLLKTYYDLGQGLLDSIYDNYKNIYKKNPEKLFIKNID